MTDAPSTTDTRRRMLLGAAHLLGERGVRAASLRELAREADVPIGSTYHHFPQGKQQLVDESVRLIGHAVQRLIERARTEGAVATFDTFIGQWSTALEATDFRRGCTVLAAATDEDDSFRATATEMFALWQTALADVLLDGGVTPERAPRLARTIVAAVEGAVALCRAERSIAPLDDVADELHLLIAGAVRS